MKKTLLLFTVLLCSIWSFSQQSYSNNHKGYSVNLTSNRSEMLLNFAIDDYKITDVLIDGVKYSKIHFNHGVNTYKKGFAELPMLNATLQIGNENDVQLSVNENDYIDIQLTNPLLPSRGTIYRNQDPKSIPYEIAPESLVDAWYPENLAENTEPFIFRDTRGVNIYVYPFRYNAAKNVLRVFKSVFVSVKEDNSKSTNALRTTVDAIDATMNDVYKSLFINYNPSKFANQIAELGEMLVIYTARDASAIQPYINWKKQKGFTVHTLEVATGTNVKSNILTAYNSNPNLLYVQLVGDWADIKSDLGTSQTAPMDPMMGCVAGTDNYSELIIGRFSASTAAQVTVQVNKTINYERNPEVGGTWYKNGLGIASDEGEGNGDDGEMDKTHMDIIKNSKLLNYTYTNVASQYAPSASAAGVATSVNGGVSVINYCGHGSETTFVTSGYSNTNINSSTNGSKLPFIWSVACVNGKFHMSGDCFAEAWLRKENGGAVATLMATINQAWVEPMRGQDYFNDILTGGYNYTTNPGNGTSTTIADKRTTFGSISFNGTVLMLAQDYNGTNTRETFQTWTLFGDASLQVRTDTPAEMVTTHNPTMFLGASTFTVNCDFDGAMVTISYLNEEENVVVIGSGVAEAGSALITFDEPVVNPADLTVTVTGYNKIPYIGLVSAVPADEPYVVLNSFTTTASPNYGAQVGINVTLENISEVPYTASNVTATITTNSEYATILEGSAVVGTIDPTQVVNINGIFEFEIANNVPDQTAIVFSITLTGEYNSENYEWIQNFTIKANAPIISIGNLTIDDAGQGTPNYLEPGETASVKVTLSNTGGAAIDDVDVELLAESLFLTITDGNETASVAANATAEVTFTVVANASTPNGLAVELSYSAEKGIFAASGSKTINIGALPEIVIGGGTQDPSTYYPLDNYYKANRTQMLYLASEVSQTPQVITHLALDIKSIGTVSVYKNLTIKLMETATAVVPGSFIATTTATTVFTAATYTMPTATGWHTFDIADFAYSGTANLLVEVSFGINDSWTSTRYKVSCSTTPAVSVAYGYDDYTALPTYDGNSSVRPNLYLTFQTEVAQSYSANFTVIDGDDVEIDGAEITIGSKVFATNSEGLVAVELPSGQYGYTATKEGFDLVTGNFTIEEADEQVLVVLGGLPKYQLEISVNNSEFGSVTGSGYYYAAEEVELLAIPATGYMFINWTNAEEEVLSTLSTFTFTMPNESVTITANFALVSSTDISGFTSVNVFPNPFTNQILLSGATNVKAVVVSSILGQELVRLSNAGNDSFEIPTSMLPQGVYLVTLFGEANETKVSKMIKK
jgi:hypothetical protein